MKYLFVSYINRSGSTYLVNLLSKSKRFCVCPESDTLVNELLRIPLKKERSLRALQRIQADHKLKMWNLDPGKLRSVLYSNKEGSKVFLDILLLFHETHFPEAEFIVFKHNHIGRLIPLPDKDQERYHIALLRNPVNMYLSQKKTVSPETRLPMCTNVYQFCSQYMDFFIRFRSKDFLNSYRLQYEDLINNEDEVMKDLFAYLGIQQTFKSLIDDQGKITAYLDKDYRKIHVNIDRPPDTSGTELVLDQLTDYEKFVIQKHLLPVRNYYVLPDQPLTQKFKYRIRLMADKADFMLKRIKKWLRMTIPG